MELKIWQKNLGSSLTAASLAALGSSGALAASGCPKWVLFTVAIIGAVMGIAGVFTSHLFAVDQAAIVKQGQAIDVKNGDAVPPAPSVLAGTIQPPTVFKNP